MGWKYERTDVKLTCEFCGEEFWRKSREHARSLKLNRKEYCSLKCAAAASNAITPRHASPEDIARIKQYARNRADEFTRFRWFLARVRARDKKRERKSDLTLEYLVDIWDKQKGICPLSGVSLNLPNTTTGFKQSDPYNASLDRIDPNKWYTQKNVRFIALIANFTKAQWTDQEVMEFCYSVVKHQKLR